MSFLNNFTIETIITIVVIIIVILLRVLLAKLIRSYAKTHSNIEHRTNLMIKYVHLLINILAFISFIIIWGVQKKDLFITISSVTTVIGVAMFAQWSILSNITSGVILFFFFPFKIGDKIRIHDKDFPIEGKIEDIRAFHVELITIDGEKIIYPNNLLLQKGISIITEKFIDKDFLD